MTQHDADYWQNQTDQADQIRLILERAFLLAWQRGEVEQNEHGSWQYRDGEQQLIYDPHSDNLTMESIADGWHIVYHEGGLVTADTEITPQLMQEFEALQDSLDREKIPETVNLQQLAPINAAPNLADRLFEQYVDFGSVAYQDPESGVWNYCVEVDNHTFVISRDDRTLTYQLEKEGGNLTNTDIETLETLAAFNATPIPTVDSTPNWSQPTWEEQRSHANLILTIGQALWQDYEQREELSFDPTTERYVAPLFDEFIGCYDPKTDDFQITSAQTPIASARDWNRFYNAESGWHLSGLEHLGSITPTQVDRFLAAQVWQTLRNQFDQSEKQSLRRSMIDDRRIDQVIPTVPSEQSKSSEQSALPTTTQPIILSPNERTSHTSSISDIDRA